MIALLVGVFMLADRGDLESMLPDFSGADIANNDPAEISGTNRFNGHVARIVDGDTFWISGQNVRVRIWALDAPETAAPGGAAATAELARLTSGQEVICRQRDIDRHGRIVGQCWLPNGRDIAVAMIDSGAATEYCRFSRNHYGTCCARHKYVSRARKQLMRRGRRPVVDARSRKRTFAALVMKSYSAYLSPVGRMPASRADGQKPSFSPWSESLAEPVKRVEAGISQPL